MVDMLFTSDVGMPDDFLPALDETIAVTEAGRPSCSTASSRGVLLLAPLVDMAPVAPTRLEI